jgi:microcystin-dependent protein
MNFRLLPSRKLTGAVALVAVLLLGAVVAYAADALIIEEDGTIKIEKRLNFGGHSAELITLWDPGYAMGIQSKTLYSRSGKNFAWYTGGKHNDAELNPGGGTKAMSLSGGDLTVSGSLTSEKGSFVGMGAVPPGAIMMWSGDPKNLPKGWVLCDSQNGTPDLRSRFIVGYDPRHAVNKTMHNTGGKDEVTLTTSEMGDHRHTIVSTLSGLVTGTHKHGGLSTTTGGTIPAFGAPSATGTVDPTKAPVPFDNRPPYYVLAYIMYTGK